MVYQTYSTNQYIENIDTVITYIFIGEFGIKTIASGFIIDKNSYLRDSWN